MRRQIAVLLLSIGVAGCGGDDTEASYCGELRSLRNDQAALTPAALIALTRDELELNWQDQQRRGQSVQELLPADLRERWDEVSSVNDAVQRAVSERWPTTGDGSALRAEAVAAGFSSITEFVWPPSMVVNGRTWTFEEWRSYGSDLDDDLNRACGL